jgi:hypothetical protein
MASSPEFWISSRPEIEIARAACRIGNSAAVKVCEGLILSVWYPEYQTNVELLL